jgi:hypothetical protein
VSRYPYHRYLTYLVLSGENTDDVISNLSDLEYVPPEAADVDAIRDGFRGRLFTADLRESLGLSFFDGDSSSTLHMFWIVETAAVRSCAEHLLLDRVDPDAVSTILGLKFGREVTRRGVEMFRDGFWDTTTLTAVDFTNYFRRGGKRKPDPPPSAVPLTQRPAYAAWAEGIIPDETQLPVEDMVRSISVDSYFRFKNLSSRPDVDSQRQALSFASMVLKTGTAQKQLSAIAKARGKGAGTDMSLKPMLEYPDNPVPTLADLHRQYAEDTSGTGTEVDSVSVKESGNE